MVVLLEGSIISTEELWSSVKVIIEFLVTSLTKAIPLPDQGQLFKESWWFQTSSI